MRPIFHLMPFVIQNWPETPCIENHVILRISIWPLDTMQWRSDSRPLKFAIRMNFKDARLTAFDYQFDTLEFAKRLGDLKD
jgi:hypothetical protein